MLLMPESLEAEVNAQHYYDSLERFLLPPQAHRLLDGLHILWTCRWSVSLALLSASLGTSTDTSRLLAAFCAASVASWFQSWW